jgi:glycosyltransferase involved in cell wall biosynthesis
MFRMAHADAPTRILMTADAVGGVWTYAVDLCRELDRRGIDVGLAVMGPAPVAEQRDELASLPHVTLHEKPFQLEWMPDPWDDVEAAGDWLTDLEIEVEPNLVHLNGYFHGACQWRVPSLVVGHSCVLSWWRAVMGEPAPPDWDRYAAEVRRGLQNATAVVAPSSGMLASLASLYGPLPASSVIANGRSPGTGPMAKEPFILTSGRLWDAAKNVAAVCDVATDLQWPVVVAGPLDQAGSGPRPGRMRQGQVCYLGRLHNADLRQWMARASIYVLPARYEPFGLSVLEAAQAGCALVLGDIPTLRGIWGDSAVYVDPGDSAALRHAVQGLIEDDDRRHVLAAAAMARASTFTAQRMADQYCALYRELIGERCSVLSLSAV